MSCQKKFNEWFTSNATEFTFICEQFYSDCELNDLELRKSLLKGWLIAAFRAGYNAFLEDAITTVLYGDIEEASWDVISDHCKKINEEIIDWEAMNNYDEEQQLRLSIAATLKTMQNYQ
jgi:hypothetical protein